MFDATKKRSKKRIAPTTGLKPKFKGRLVAGKLENLFKYTSVSSLIHWFVVLQWVKVKATVAVPLGREVALQNSQWIVVMVEWLNCCCNQRL